MKTKSTKDLFGSTVELVMAAIVFAFMWSQSLYTFQFLFPAEKWWLAYLGLGLTGGGMIGYFILLKRGSANTPARRYIVLSMLVVCTIGEIAAAGFGMTLEALQKTGQTLTPEFLNLMVNTVRGLGLLHALALMGFFGWDDISAALNDKNGNGIPDHLEARPAYAQTSPAPVMQTSYKLADLIQTSGKTAQQMRSEFPDYERFAPWCSGQFDSISGKNMRKIYYGELNPTAAGGANNHSRPR